ncbi:hypothetical protein [Streptococcus equi]|nr:hypothetical protein [Streptococcus equi]MCD3487137.1 hypothetical protein [Streptococcus equi subsp. equi]
MIAWKRQGLQVDHQSLYQYNTAMKDYFSRYKFKEIMFYAVFLRRAS